MPEGVATVFLGLTMALSPGMNSGDSLPLYEALPLLKAVSLKAFLTARLGTTRNGRISSRSQSDRGHVKPGNASVRARLSPAMVIGPGAFLGGNRSSCDRIAKSCWLGNHKTTTLIRLSRVRRYLEIGMVLTSTQDRSPVKLVGS